MRQRHDHYELDDALDRIDFARVHGWLSTTYWAAGRSLERVTASARHSSLVVGAYVNTEQVGFLRIVSDRVAFAWVSDVIVDPAHQGRGLARAMVGFALAHPDHQGISRWVLRTKDAHGVYAALGFEPFPDPGQFMQLVPKARDGSTLPP